MELRFGTHVLEHGYRIGRLSGVEIDPTTRAVHRIAFRTDAGSEEETRPLAAVTVDDLGNGDIHFHLVDAVRTRPATELVRLTDATRVVHTGRPIGQLSGVEVAADAGTLTAVFGRQHWWTRQFRFDAASLDLSVPGEIRISAAPSRAA
jgi:sporulation protein YlmC with PRC-barrel domain